MMQPIVGRCTAIDSTDEAKPAASMPKSYPSDGPLVCVVVTILYFRWRRDVAAMLSGSKPGKGLPRSG